MKQKTNFHLKKNALHEEMGIPDDKKISDKKLDSADKNASPLEKKRIQFALNAKKWNKR